MFALGVCSGWLMRQPGNLKRLEEEPTAAKNSGRTGSRPATFKNLSGRELLSNVLQGGEDPMELLMADQSWEDILELARKLAASPAIWDWRSDESELLRHILEELVPMAWLQDYASS